MTELEIEVKTVEEEGAPVAFVLVVNKPYEYGYKVILPDLARAKMALALLESLPDVMGDNRENINAAENTMREYVDQELEKFRHQAKNRAMNAAKKAGATDANNARERVNSALGREAKDRSLLSSEEWDRAAETLREMGAQA